jgi:putative ABC transport system substrate-binding protein
MQSHGDHMARTADRECSSCTRGAEGLGRRAFLNLLAATVSSGVVPPPARAQQPATPVIGFVSPRSPEQSANYLTAFRRGLGEAGYAEGRNIRIEYRFANDRLDRVPELVADLVQRRVAVIAAPSGLAAAIAAKASSIAVPLVFSTAGDPIRAGVVASLNRPGGNITGVTDLGTELGAKQLGLLNELLPAAARFALLVNPTSPLAEPMAIDVRAAAAAIGRQIEVLTASTARDIDAAFARLLQSRADALLVVADAFFAARRVHLINLTVRHGMPVMFPYREDAQAGALMSYGPSVAERDRQMGIYTGRILKGEKPADLPVLQAVKFDFVVNLQTARTLGVEIPTNLLARADEVIE